MPRKTKALKARLSNLENGNRVLAKRKADELSKNDFDFDYEAEDNCIRNSTEEPLISDIDEFLEYLGPHDEYEDDRRNWTEVIDFNSDDDAHSDWSSDGKENVNSLHHQRNSSTTKAYLAG